MKLLPILVFCVTASSAGVVQQQHSQNVVRLAYSGQPQGMQYTIQSPANHAPSSHEEFAHLQHAQFVASQQQQKLAKIAFGQSQPSPVATAGAHGTFPVSQSVSSSPQTHFKYLLPHHQHPQKLVPVATPQPQVQPQYVPLKVQSHTSQTIRYAPPPAAPAPVPVQATHQYIVSHHHHESSLPTRVIPHTTHQIVLAPPHSQSQSQQPAEPQHVRYVATTPARVSTVPVSLQAAPLKYNPSSISSSANRNVDTLTVMKTISPVISKNSQNQVHVQPPSYSISSMQDFTHDPASSGKVAEVVQNTRYTSYASPSVGVTGPVTFTGPVGSIGANAGANAILALLSGHASGPPSVAGYHALAQPQLVAQQPAGISQGVPTSTVLHHHHQPQLQTQIPPSTFQLSQGPPQVPVHLQHQHQQPQYHQQYAQQQLQQQQQVQQQLQQQQAQHQLQQQQAQHQLQQHHQIQQYHTSSGPVQQQIQITQFQPAQPLPQPLPVSRYTESPTIPTPSLYAIQQQPQYSRPVQVLGQEGSGLNENPIQLQDIRVHPHAASQTSTDLNHPIQQLQATSVGESLGNSIQELSTDVRGSYAFQTL